MPFAPTDIANCALWLQAADLLNGGTLPSDGATVTTWKDKSGNARDLSASSAGSLIPTFKASAIGGKPGVQFYGSGTATANAAKIMQGGTVSLVQPGTLFVVTQLLVLNSTGLQYLTDGNTARWLIRNSDAVLDGTNHLCLYAGTALNGSVPTNGLLSPSVVTAQFNGLASLSRFNGTQVTSGDAGTQGLDALSVGGSPPNNAQCNGYICEVIVYAAALSGQQIQQVVTYLGGSYGISLQEAWVVPWISPGPQHYRELKAA